MTVYYFNLVFLCLNWFPKLTKTFFKSSSLGLVLKVLNTNAAFVNSISRGHSHRMLCKTMNERPQFLIIRSLSSFISILNRHIPRNIHVNAFKFNFSIMSLIIFLRRIIIIYTSLLLIRLKTTHITEFSYFFPEDIRVKLKF